MTGTRSKRAAGVDNEEGPGQDSQAVKSRSDQE